MELNLMKYFIFLYKNFKLLIFFFIVGIVIALIAIFFIYNKEKEVVFKQIIEVPTYTDKFSQTQPIISNYNMNVILQVVLKEIKQVDKNNLLLKKTILLHPIDKNTVSQDKSIAQKDNYKLKQEYDDQNIYFSLFVQSKKNNQKVISKQYDQIIKDFSKSSLLINKISAWKSNLKEKIKSETEKLVEYDGLINQNEKYFKSLTSKNLSDSIKLNANDLTQPVILEQILKLKKETFKLKHLISEYNQELHSVNAEISRLGSVIIEPIYSKILYISLIVGLMVILGSIILTLLYGFFKEVALNANAAPSS